MRSVIEGTKGNCDEQALGIEVTAIFGTQLGGELGGGLGLAWTGIEHGIYLCTGFLALPNSSLLSSSSSSPSLFLFPLGGTIVIVVGVPKLETETEAEASSTVCNGGIYRIRL